MQHLKVILGVRNDILHFGAYVEPAHFTVSNAAHTVPRQAKTYRLRITRLDEMSDDLSVINARLIWAILSTKHDSDPRLLIALDAIALTPWRYKPSSEDLDHEAPSPARKRPKRASTQPARQPASQE